MTTRGFKIALALVIAIRLWNAVAYHPTWQQGAKIHFGYMRDLTQLHIPASYNAPWLYILTLLISAPVSVPLKLLGAKQSVVLHASVGFTQTLLFFFMLIGCYRLGRRLWGTEGGLRFAVLVGAFPLVQRVVGMVRPETLLMALTPWIILLYLQVAPLANRSLGKLARSGPYLALVAAQTLMVAQKVSGVVVLGTVPAFLASARMSLRDCIRLLLKIIPVVLLLAALLIGLQGLISGRTPLQHDLGELGAGAQKLCPEGFRAAPASFFVTFRPSLTWTEPFRDVHRGSMPEILFIDFHGDYWRFGIDARGLNRPETNRLLRARYGLILTSCFALLWLFSWVAVLLSKSAAAPAERRNLFAAAMCLLGSALFLCAVSLKFYCPEDADIAKWEYVAWSLVFLPVPLIAASRVLAPAKGRVYDAALLAVTFAGLVQCIVTRLF